MHAYTSQMKHDGTLDCQTLRITDMENFRFSGNGNLGRSFAARLVEVTLETGEIIDVTLTEIMVK